MGGASGGDHSSCPAAGCAAASPASAISVPSGLSTLHALTGRSFSLARAMNFFFSPLTGDSLCRIRLEPSSQASPAQPLVLPDSDLALVSSFFGSSVSSIMSRSPCLPVVKAKRTLPDLAARIIFLIYSGLAHLAVLMIGISGVG